MLTTDEEYRQIIAELDVINRQMVDRARALPGLKTAGGVRWITELDQVIEKHRNATRRLRELVIKRKVR